MTKFILGLWLVLLCNLSLADGLKKVDYKNETTESQRPAILNSEAGGATLSDEEAKKVMEQIQTIKANQEASHKMLEELEKEE